MQIKTINTERVLSPTQISIADYVINPYRGCEFCCLYCYTQENKNIKEGKFAGCVGIKLNAPQVLEKELRQTKPKHILLGSTTECFQPQESKHKITEKILKILNKNNISYTILTKSHYIKDYLPLISQNKDNKIYFTLNSVSNDTINLLEKKSSNLQQRIGTIKEILNQKINLRIHVGPFIPYVCSLEDVFKTVAELGVTEIDVELYHYKMGNFKAIQSVIKDKERLEEVYSSEQNYYQYSDDLKTQIKTAYAKYLPKQTKIFYIVPDYNKFYSHTIDYEKSFL